MLSGFLYVYVKHHMNLVIKETHLSFLYSYLRASAQIALSDESDKKSIREHMSLKQSWW